MDEALAGSLRWKRLFLQVSIAAAAWVVLLLGAAIWWAGGSAWGHLRGAGWEFWLATFGLFAASHLLRFVRWHWMLFREGYRLPATRSLSIFLAGLALLPTPGKAGVAVRSLLLLREGVPGNVSLAAWFAERLFDFLGLVAVAALVVAGQSSPARWGAALGVGLAGLVAVRLAPGACSWISARAKAGWLRRASAWAARFFGHASDLVSGRVFLPYLLIGIAANAMTGFLLWLAVERFGASAGLVDCIGIVGVSHLFGSLSLLPGGLGGFEVAMLGQLAAVGMAPDGAVASVAVVRMATIWGSVLVGLLLLFSGIRRERGLGSRAASMETPAIGG
jgi:uncharacterized membrane protein YbhN (UPF0104 family)